VTGATDRAPYAHPSTEDHDHAHQDERPHHHRLKARMLGSVVHNPVGASPSVLTGFFAPTGLGDSSGCHGPQALEER